MCGQPLRGKREKGKGKRRITGRPHRSSAAQASGPRLSFYPYLAAGLLLVLLAGPWAIAGVEAVPVPLKQSFDHFPMQLGPWEGRHVHVDPEIVAATGADKVLNADFMNPDSRPGLFVDCLL